MFKTTETVIYFSIGDEREWRWQMSVDIGQGDTLDEQNLGRKPKPACHIIGASTLLFWSCVRNRISHLLRLDSSNFRRCGLLSRRCHSSLLSFL